MDARRRKENLFILLTCLIANLQKIHSSTDGPRLQIIPTGAEFERPLGDNIVFTCEIAGLGPQIINTNLQWFDTTGREITETAGGGRLVYVEIDEHSPTKKLYFTQIQQKDAGTYTCAGIVEGNRQEQRVALLLYKPITFEHAPTPQYPTKYTTALIQCRVSGQPNPTVSWRYKGIKIQTAGRYAQDQFGLIIKNITTDDDGFYTCRAEVDREGRYEERLIRVIVYTPPKIHTDQSLSYIGTQSQQFVISCRVSDGLPAPKFEFRKDNNENPLYSTDRYQVDGNSGEISFRPLHKEDEGVYHCRAYNEVGEDYGQISLTVRVPPTIFDLKNVTQVEHSSITLVCQSYGDPAPIMAFRKAGESREYLMGENDGGRIIQSNPDKGRLELLIRNLVPTDMSNYTCLSRNDAGFHERNGTITVNFRPLFAADQITEIYSWAGKTRNMTCNVLAEPMPFIEWRKFDRAIANNETFRVYRMGKNSNLQITIRQVDEEWIYGNFTCLASNAQGANSTKITLRRATVPSKPSAVDIIEIQAALVRLRIAAPLKSGGAEILGYRVSWGLGENLDFQLYDDVLVENLRPSTTYVIHIRALSEVGLGEPASISVTMKDVSKPGQLVLTSDRKSTMSYQYTVTWEKPDTGGLPIREYDFKFRKVDYGMNNDIIPLSDWILRRIEESVYEPRRYYLLENLESGTRYQLEVVARNDIGDSQPTDEFIFETAGSFNPGGGNQPIVTGSESVVCSTRFTLTLSLLTLCYHYINIYLTTPHLHNT